MKTIETLTILTLFSLCCGPSAFAQGEPTKQPEPSTKFMKHLVEVYACIAPFDENKNGKLEVAEEDTILAALENGKLELPMPPTGPLGMTPPKAAMPDPEMMIGHISEMYATTAATDVDKSGTLDATEQANLAVAFKKGNLPFPGNPGGPLGGRPPGIDGPGH